MLFRPSVVRSSSRRSSLSSACAVAFRLTSPSSCLFALIVACRVFPVLVSRVSCRWQSACVCFLRSIFFVGYDVELRGFLRLLVPLCGWLASSSCCLIYIHYVAFLYCFSCFSANHWLAPLWWGASVFFCVVSSLCVVSPVRAWTSTVRCCSRG